MLGCRGRGTAAGMAYAAHPRTEVVGVCDLVREARDTLGEVLGVKARFEDFNKMIDEVAPDIVAIPTGTEFHFDIGMQVLDRGVHIDVEKPMCIDLEQTDRLVERAEQRGVQIAVHHQGRTGAPMKAVEKAYREGRVGELRYVFGSGKGYYGGYGLMNIGTHSLNNVIHLAGHCHRVRATAHTGGHAISPEDVVQSPSGMGTITGEYISAVLDFDGDVTGVLVQHRFSAVDSNALGSEFRGTEGRLFLGSYGAYYHPAPRDVPGRDSGPWEELPLDSPERRDAHTGVWAEELDYVDDYVRALDEGRPHASSGEEGRHVMEIMMGIFEAAAYGVSVELPQERRDHPLLRWREENNLGPPDPMPRPYDQWLAAEDERIGRNRA
jgi:predicted dehydrogenase